MKKNKKKNLVLKIFLVGVKTYNTTFSKNTAFLNHIGSQFPYGCAEPSSILKTVFVLQIDTKNIY